jgi:hypothetical protein
MAGSSHLKQGETSEITARSSTTDKKGDIQETIEVKSNDPKRPVVTLTMKATVKQKILQMQQDGVCK